MIKSIYGRTISMLILVLIIFSACRVGKDYQRPELELPEKFNNVSFSDTNSVADIEWKSFFADSNLQNLITKGLQYNHDLLVALKRIEIAQQQVKQAKALLLPEVGVNVQAQYNRPSKNSLNGKSANSILGKDHIEYYSAGLNVSWEADIWGKIQRQKEASLANYLQTYEAAKAVQTQLVAGIAQGYFNLQMLDRQLEISKKSLELNESFLKITRLLRDAGEATTLAVQQAASQKQSTSLLIPRLEQSIGLQENALRILAGQLPGTIERSTSLHPELTRDNPSVGLPLAIVSRRPDVRSSEMALVAANAQVGIAQANMYPALNITAGGGLESFKASNWFNIPNSLFGLAAGAIAQPVFKRRELKTRFETAKLERDEAVTRFRQSVLQATGEVSDALVRIQKLKEEQEIAKEQADTLRHAVSNAELLFKSDMANYLEVIIAQSNRLNAELDLALIERERLGAMVELYRSLGGGWK